MLLRTITLEDISSLKSATIINLTCDSCGVDIPRSVKAIRHSIKNSGATQAFCSNKCQGAMLKKTYTKNCERCGTEFVTSDNNTKNCSRTCANIREHTQETKDKISSTLKGKVVENKIKSDVVPKPKKTNKISKPRKISNLPSRYHYRHSDADFCTINICKCKNCEFVGSYRTQRGYCPNCEDMYSSNKRAMYQFTFNVYHYPDLFDLNLLESVGWRVTRGKNKNVFGISRDHKVSVRDSIINNYDPYYIKHPLNCELMTHDENQRKGTKSSMSYDELVKLVDDYENGRPTGA